MRTVALVALGATAIAAFASVVRPSEAAAAPKRHQQVQYYTITLTASRAPRGPRLKSKPQTSPSDRHFQGFVSRFSAGQRNGAQKRPAFPTQRARQTTIINDM
jgi:hypothetical protein